MPIDPPSWAQFEGETIDERFRLDRFVGPTTDGGGIFETSYHGKLARIEITPAAPAELEASRKHWHQTSSLAHPALAPILASGVVTDLADRNCGYVVMERADEYLGDVLTDRNLTAEEARELLPPLLDAVSYLQSRGFRHTKLTPASLMACGEQLKLASDGIVSGRDDAQDSAAIGRLLQQLLGIADPAQMPPPFGDIAAHCFADQPSERWSVAQISASLQPPTQARPARRASWMLAAAAIAAIGVAGVLASRSPSVDPPPAPAAVVAPAPISLPVDKPSAIPLAVPPKTTKIRPATPAPKKPRVDEAANAAATPAASLPGPAAARVMPDIPRQALNTISGRVRVNARVHVDSDGRVTQAQLEGPTASKYFSSRVLAAARAWKFPASGAPRDVLLSFELARDGIRVNAQ